MISCSLELEMAGVYAGEEMDKQLRRGWSLFVLEVHSGWERMMIDFCLHL